jgi:DOPA 4,5-dioxygenase
MTSSGDRRIIESYHAHIYYDPASTRARADELRSLIASSFPQAKLGRWHDELVGPHPHSMYQVAFPSEMLAAFVPWMMLNRGGLTVLLHPQTGNPYRDHTAHAVWFGAALPLRLEAFKNRDAD